eukprot:205849-Chlamydomonas_euryale.AAC.1
MGFDYSTSCRAALFETALMANSPYQRLYGSGADCWPGQPFLTHGPNDASVREEGLRLFP